MKLFKVSWEVTNVYTGGKEPVFNTETLSLLVRARTAETAANKVVRRVGASLQGRSIKVDLLHDNISDIPG